MPLSKKYWWKSSCLLRQKVQSKNSFKDLRFCTQNLTTVFRFFRDFLQLLKALTSVWSYHKNQWLPQSGVFSGVGGCGGLMEPFGCLFISYCALWGKTFVVKRKVWQHHWSNFAFATINTLCIAKGSMILICSRLLHNRASKVICLSGKKVTFSLNQPVTKNQILNYGVYFYIVVAMYQKKQTGLFSFQLWQQH